MEQLFRLLVCTELNSFPSIFCGIDYNFGFSQTRSILFPAADLLAGHCILFVPCDLVLNLWVQILLLRSKFHEPPHNIPGNVVEDCLCATFCGWCTVQQCARHLQANPSTIRGDPYLFAPAATNVMEAEKPAAPPKPNPIKYA